MMEGFMGEVIVRMMEKKCENELSPHNMYAFPQLDTCHVGRYFGPLVPNFMMQEHLPHQASQRECKWTVGRAPAQILKNTLEVVA
jgi:hypothetical protein